jgi:hypothetical protein
MTTWVKKNPDKAAKAGMFVLKLATAFIARAAV